MEHLQKTVEFFNAIEKGQWFEVYEMLDDDFKFYGSLPDPFNKEQTIAFQQAVYEAFPDLSFTVKKIEDRGDKVLVKLGAHGTHTGSLELPFLGLKPIPPSHVKIDLPIEKAEVKFRNDQIEIIHLNIPLHGGLFGILEQIGFESTE